MQLRRIYIGYDQREQAAYDVACHSAHKHASKPIDIVPLDAERLAASGLLRRPVDRRTGRYDLLSNAPASTDFAISRFLTPILAQSGWVMFCDSDVVFLEDPTAIIHRCSSQYAVHCVKHSGIGGFGGATKMDGQVQTGYPRKLWSSVMMFNCDHPANRRLTLDDVNHRPGRDLHAFYWLNDEEIGHLPREWNWLVGLQEKPSNASIAHFTLGTPDLPGVPDHPDHVIWWRAQAEMKDAT